MDKKLPLGGSLILFFSGVLMVKTEILTTGDGIGGIEVGDRETGRKKTERARSPSKMHSASSDRLQKSIPDIDPDSVEFSMVEEAIENVSFPRDKKKSIQILNEELAFVSTLTPSLERDDLAKLLAQKYLEASFLNESEPSELLDRIGAFYKLVQRDASPDQDGQICIFAGILIAKNIKAKPEEERSNLIAFISAHESTGSDLNEWILGGLHAHTLLDSDLPVPKDFLSISNPKVRKFAERTFFRTFDFTAAGEKTTSHFARYYLSGESQIESDHTAEVRLFGLGLQKFPEAVSKAIIDAPPGLKRDLAIEQMIFRFVEEDPATIKLWYNEISNSEIKARASKDIDGQRKRPPRYPPLAPGEGELK